MTTPTETAIAALEKLRHEIISNADSRYDAQVESLIDILIDAFTAPDTALRAPVDERRAGHSKLVYNKATRTIDTVHTPPPAAGGMKAAEWYAELLELRKDNSLSNGPVWYDFIQRIQTDALATQPEARPLRELITEGHEQFWVKLPGEHHFVFVSAVHGRGTHWLRTQYGDDMGIEELNDCPAIATHKPTVTP